MSLQDAVMNSLLGHLGACVLVLNYLHVACLVNCILYSTTYYDVNITKSSTTEALILNMQTT